jgi:hypothetical protein
MVPRYRPQLEALEAREVPTAYSFGTLVPQPAISYALPAGLLDTLVSQPAIVLGSFDFAGTAATNSQQAPADWFSTHLPDAAIANMARADWNNHGSVNFADMVAIYSQIERSGSLTANEMSSLQALFSLGDTLGTPKYVQFLEGKVVNGDRANAALGGNLHVGSSAWQVSQVAGDWFLGTALPALVPGEGSYFNYNDPSGALFGGGLSYTQVHQGGVGDCTLMASLSEVAARLPGTIQSMFIYDGFFNGTAVWTVRLFAPDGSACYVTVNSYLPSFGAQAQGGAPWAALAEKAFAEANASGWLKSFNPGAGDSYAAINGGNSGTVVAYLSALTGLTSSAWAVFSGGSSAVNPTLIAQELKAGKLVVVATGDHPASSFIVPDHCYAVVGYNASSSLPFTVYNPWGAGDFTNFNGHQVYGSTFTCNAAFLQQNFVFWGVTSPTF